MGESKTLVVGIGSAGCRIVSRIAGGADGAIVIAAVDTDAGELERAQAQIKKQIGQDETRGHGAGGDVDLVRGAAEEEQEALRSLFQDVGLAVIVAGLGGGTGTGAAPRVLELAREAGAATLCFATLPCEFEGALRKKQAERWLDDLRASADTMVLVSNDRLFEASGEQNMAGAFSRADEILGGCVGAIACLSGKTGHINISFGDLRRIIEHSGGACTLGYGEGKGKNRLRKALEELLKGPLMNQGAALEKAGSLLVSIMGGSDLSVSEVRDIMNAVSSRVSPDCRVSMGTVLDKNLKGCLRVVIIAVESQPVEIVPEPKEEAVVAKAGLSKKKGAFRAEQTSLGLDGAFGKGRFKDAEPTVQDGENLDIPTFLRRGIPIEK